MSAGGVVALPAELVEFVESGVSILVGTRDARLRPEALRACGAIVAPDRRSITILMNELTSQRTVANLRAGSPLAVTFSRPIDYRTVQIKGPCRDVRAADAREGDAARKYLAQFCEQLYLVSISRAFTARLRVSPTLATVLEIHELFEQTPGPGAGRKLGAPA